MTQTRELVYGRRPVHEVLRAGRRQILEVLATERARASEPWLDELTNVHVRPERDLTEAAHTRDHQGVVAFCDPYRYVDAWELAAAPTPLIVCLDQVTDPHNLGAVVPQRRGRGATGVVVTERRSARVTPAVCSASAGAVEHLPVAVVVNLARYIEETKSGTLWAWAAEREAQTSVWSADLHDRRLPRARLGGPGDPPERSPRLRRRVLDPARRPGRIAERERRGRRVALRGRPAARPLRCLSRPSTCSTATTSSTRPRSAARRSSWTPCPGSWRSTARGAWSSSTASARNGRSAPSTFRFAEPADALLERLAAGAAQRGARSARLVRPRRAGNRRAGGRAPLVEGLRRRAGRDSRRSRTVPRPGPSRIEDALDEETRTRLERWRRKRP